MKYNVRSHLISTFSSKFKNRCVININRNNNTKIKSQRCNDRRRISKCGRPGQAVGGRTGSNSNGHASSNVARCDLIANDVAANDATWHAATNDAAVAYRYGRSNDAAEPNDDADANDE